jgi:demethylmenaquinone methyltransferase / 2-methoxy-6-polyprenyl-1,4-benzoquinol methylase
MANTFYDAGDQRAARVNDLFATVAARYDLMNDVQSLCLHRFWKNRLVRLAHAKAGEHALDLCCGTGDLSFALARRGANVVGLDFSEPMLERARRKQSSDPAATASNLQFVQGDAQQLPFADNSFEIVTIGYGLRNLASFETGLREMLRVAKPGGRLLVLEFGKPDSAVLRALYFGYMKFFVPVLGSIFCGNAAAYSYILESLNHYPAQRGVDKTMKELGLKNVRILNFLRGIMSINYAEKSLK